MTELWNESDESPTSGELYLRSLRSPRFKSPLRRGTRSDVGTTMKSGRKSGRIMRGSLVGVLAVVLLCAPSIGLAGEKAADVSRESGLGAAAALSSLIYGPVKLIYATGGLVVGAFAWVFTAGDAEVAEKVFTRSLRGTYVITPEILLGEERLEFIGRDSEPYQPRTEAVAAADISVGSVEDSGYDEMGW